MSIGEEIVKRLEELIMPEALEPCQGKPLMVHTQHGPIAVEAQVLGFDRVGCSFAELSVHSTDPAGDGPSLKTRAEVLVERLTYLMERLTVIELDDTSQHAQLRSAPPRQANGVVEYYEAHLSRGQRGNLELRLARYRQARDTQRRTQVPLNLTREALNRLLEDVADVVGPARGQASDPGS